MKNGNGIALWATLATATTAGCGAMFETTAAETKFRETFSCAAETATRAGHHITVSGCGVVAHFTCHPPGGRSGMLDSAFMGNGACVLRSAVGRGPSRSTFERLRAGATPEGHLRLEATLFAGDDRVTVVGIPEDFPEQVAFDITSPSNASTAVSCRVAVYADGEALSGVGDPVRAEDDVRFVVTMEALGRMAHAARLTADICGRSSEIDTSDIALLAQFDVRLREERARRLR